MTTQGLTDESKISSNLDEIETPVAFITHSNRVEEENSLERRTIGISTDSHGCGGCQGSNANPYNELRPYSPYDELFSEKETFIETVPSKIEIFDTETNTVITHPTGWTPPLTGTNHEDCLCGDYCMCPPLVCENGDCNNSYVVVFASKKCKKCKQLWPVIKKLRKEGYIVFYVDTKKYPSVYKQFDLKKWPTIIIMDNGRPMVRFNGVTTFDKLVPHLKTLKEQGLEIR